MPSFVVCLAALAIAVGYTFSKGLGVNNAQLTRVPPARDSRSSSPLPISLGTHLGCSVGS
jgi:hypothetical protein